LTNLRIDELRLANWRTYEFTNLRIYEFTNLRIAMDELASLDLIGGKISREFVDSYLRQFVDS